MGSYRGMSGYWNKYGTHFFIYLYSFTGDTTISRRKSKETAYQTIFRWIQENPNQQSWNKGM